MILMQVHLCKILLIEISMLMTSFVVWFGCGDALLLRGFKLTKFITNYPILLDDIPTSDRAGEVKEINQDFHAKTLGVRWDVSGDAFYYVRKQ